MSRLKVEGAGHGTKNFVLAENFLVYVSSSLGGCVQNYVVVC